MTCDELIRQLEVLREKGYGKERVLIYERGYPSLREIFRVYSDDDGVVRIMVPDKIQYASVSD